MSGLEPGDDTAAAVDRAPRAAYPHGDYLAWTGEISANALADFQRLVLGFQLISGVVCDVVDASEVGERCWYILLAVGTSALGIQEAGSTRSSLARIEQLDEPLVWKIRVSKLGSFWSGYWNLLSDDDGRPGARLAAEPHAGRWVPLVASARRLLQEAGYREVGGELLRETVPWLQGRGRGQAPHPRVCPTVLEALFTDFY